MLNKYPVRKSCLHAALSKKKKVFSVAIHDHILYHALVAYFSVCVSYAWILYCNANFLINEEIPAPLVFTTYCSFHLSSQYPEPTLSRHSLG